MKKLLFIIAFFSCVSFAQFKDETPLKPSIVDGMVDRSPNFILGFFDADKFSMHHSYSMSYTTGGGEALALGVYTNSMMYKFTDNLNVQVDASLVHSPYSTFGKDVQNNINGIYLSKAALNYAPSKDFHVSLLYQKVPQTGYYGYGFGRNMFGNSAFYDFMGNP